MTNRWLFRVNVANERETGETEKARGIGHAMKCLSLATTANQYGDDVHFSIEGAGDVAPMFEGRGFSHTITCDHRSVIQDYNPDIIVVDINYLNVDVMTEYQKAAVVVNLAPRGLCKYYADCSFNSARIEDVAPPADSRLQEWYAGPEYAILNPGFVSLRKAIDDAEFVPRRNGVVIQMGGVDQANMTGSVLEKLDFDSFVDEEFTIIAGPLNPHVDELQKECQRYKNVSFVQDPDDFEETVASHRLGIFGAGISTYEAMAVGVPSINFGLSSFHDRRGEYLEAMDLSFYLGRHNKIDRSVLNDTVHSLLSDENKLGRLRERNMAAVDGCACDRILSTVQDLLT
jgi:spore coat polysaccharide biosynthesis predicted glycosyltransferase SpsG